MTLSLTDLSFPEVLVSTTPAVAKPTTNMLMAVAIKDITINEMNWEHIHHLHTRKTPNKSFLLHKDLCNMMNVCKSPIQKAKTTKLLEKKVFLLTGQ